MRGNLIFPPKMVAPGLWMPIPKGAEGRGALWEPWDEAEPPCFPTGGAVPAGARAAVPHGH